MQRASARGQRHDMDRRIIQLPADGQGRHNGHRWG